MLDSTKIQEEYTALAISWGQAIEIGDHRVANKQNNALMRIVKKIQKDIQIAQNVLIPLFGHSDPAVRLTSSVDALNLGLSIQKAEKILSAVAADENAGVVQLMAQINLTEWNKKRNTASQQKDEQN